MVKIIYLVTSGWFIAANVIVTNSCANMGNSNAKLTNSTAKLTNSIANGLNSIAKAIKFTVKSIAKAMNSIAKTCEMIKLVISLLCYKRNPQYGHRHLEAGFG